MYLYQIPEDFQELIAAASEELEILPDIIEKDYYVSAVLQELNKVYIGLIFRGGTSLSKCFNVIDRFSEDIDISVQGHLTQSQRRELIHSIISAVEKIGLTLINPEEIRSKRDFNRIAFSYNSLYPDGVNPKIIIETYTAIESFPLVQTDVNNYIYRYLKQNDREDIASKYQLTPFTMYVQEMRRTLIDKVFALCDYYLDDKMDKYSRHIYDIYMLIKSVKLDEELMLLIGKVRELRKGIKTCLSAQDEIDINNLLRIIAESRCYENDYMELTEKLLFDNIKYDEAIIGIQLIINSNVFS